MTGASRDWRSRTSLQSLNSVKERGSTELYALNRLMILAALIESLFGAQVISFSA